MNRDEHNAGLVAPAVEEEPYMGTDADTSPFISTMAASVPGLPPGSDYNSKDSAYDPSALNQLQAERIIRMDQDARFHPDERANMREMFRGFAPDDEDSDDAPEDYFDGFTGPADYDTWYQQVYGPGLAYARQLGLTTSVSNEGDTRYWQGQIYIAMPAEARFTDQIEDISRKRKGDFLAQSANKK